jgi:zinc protease
MKMKWLMAAMSAALLLGPMQAETAKHAAKPPATNWKQIAIPELPPFNPKRPTRVVLPNGMIVFLTENHELPLISGSVMIRGGSDSEPPEKAGLVDLYGETWRTGGTEKLSGDALDDSLEARAAKVETAGGDGDTTVSFNCLKADFPDVMGIFVDLLRHPAFREDKLSLAKKQMFSEISRRNDETGDIASIQTEILGYGKQSAYARVPEYATVASVTREDLLQWHSQHVTPNNMIFGVVGDFDPKEMEAALRKSFGEWSSGEKFVEPTVVIDPAKPGIWLVDKSDVDQSEVRMIGMGIERKNPDYFALTVMNEIFGGGFSSRLFVNLRTKAGLAYSVGGGVGSNWDHPGLTVLEIGTKTETTVDAIKGLWEQVDLMKKEAPTDAEMKRAKDAILNSFIFNFDTPSKVLHEQATYEFYGYPSDFLEQYRAGVEKVTSTDVLRVANRYLHKEELKVLVVGNAGEFKTQLAELGPVTPIDITIPSPEANAETTPDSAPAAALVIPAAMAAGSRPPQPFGVGVGRATIDKLAEAMGGAAKVASVKTLRQHLRMSQENAEMTIDQSTVYPDKQAQKVVFPSGVIWQVVSPEAAFISRAKVEDLTPSLRDAVAAQLKRDFLNVLQHADDPKYTFSAIGNEKLGDTEATVVDVNADGLAVRWWIGTDGTLLQEEHTEAGAQGPQTYTIKYSRWQDFDGLKYPTKAEIFAGRTKQASEVLIDMKVNSEIDPLLFKRPQQKSRMVQ